jgi:hypothetical protein
MATVKPYEIGKPQPFGWPWTDLHPGYESEDDNVMLSSTYNTISLLRSFKKPFEFFPVFVIPEYPLSLVAP